MVEDVRPSVADTLVAEAVADTLVAGADVQVERQGRAAITQGPVRLVKGTDIRRFKTTSIVPVCRPPDDYITRDPFRWH